MNELASLKAYLKTKQNQLVNENLIVGLQINVILRMTRTKEALCTFLLNNQKKNNSILMMNQSFIEFVRMESFVSLARRDKIKNRKDEMLENVIEIKC